jgi:hypothetical protein
LSPAECNKLRRDIKDLSETYQTVCDLLARRVNTVGQELGADGRLPEGKTDQGTSFNRASEHLEWAIRQVDRIAELPRGWPWLRVGRDLLAPLDETTVNKRLEELRAAAQGHGGSFWRHEVVEPMALNVKIARTVLTALLKSAEIATPKGTPGRPEKNSQLAAFTVRLKKSGETYKDILPKAKKKFGEHVTLGALRAAVYRYRSKG